ncbi:uncharacterized protein BDW43DRAFT_270598, partial [Aspergillus alliaceus]|uniref:uncharacterized protein n=1 Tax=Petromyces alliaceus TaxID=209559 RepID=UPI0012A503ED
MGITIVGFCSCRKRSLVLLHTQLNRYQSVHGEEEGEWSVSITSFDELSALSAFFRSSTEYEWKESVTSWLILFCTLFFFFPLFIKREKNQKI